MQVSISPSARKFMQAHQIDCVTFKLKEMEPAGCCVGIVKEIEPSFDRPPNTDRYRHFQAEGKDIYIYRDIKIIGSLRVTTEGFWKMRRLALNGVTIPL